MVRQSVTEKENAPPASQVPVPLPNHAYIKQKEPEQQPAVAVAAAAPSNALARAQAERHQKHGHQRSENDKDQSDTQSISTNSTTHSVTKKAGGGDSDRYPVGMRRRSKKEYKNSYNGKGSKSSLTKVGYCYT